MFIGGGELAATESTLLAAFGAVRCAGASGTLDLAWSASPSTLVPTARSIFRIGDSFFAVPFAVDFRDVVFFAADFFPDLAI